MIGEPVLLTVAEIGVAFAGFVSVVTVFQRRNLESWALEDAMRFKTLIVPSLSAILFALLPFAFQFFGATEAVTWPV